MRSFLLFALLGACKGSGNVGLGGGDDSAGDDTGTEWGGGGGGGKLEVSSLEAVCSNHQDQFYQWIVTGEYDDPQNDVPMTGHKLEVSTDGDLFDELGDLVICDDNRCSASFRDTETSISCGDPTIWLFTLTVIDDQGHEASLSASGSSE